MKQNEQEGEQLNDSPILKNMLKYTTSNNGDPTLNQLAYNNHNIQQTQQPGSIQGQKQPQLLKSTLDIEKLENDHQFQYVKLKIKKFDNQVVYYKPRSIKLKDEIKIQQKDKKSNEKPEADGNWSQYLQYWYNRYCKTGYTLGRNPTFQNIKQKSSVMKIGNFVEFCRDFQIGLSLKKLMEIFKSATNYKTTMSMDDFFSSIRQISAILFNRPESTDQADENEFLIDDKGEDIKVQEEISFQKSPQWLDTVAFLQINNKQLFKKKINQLDKKKKLGKLMDIKTKSMKYEYEPQPLNGRAEQAIKDELKVRKMVRNEVKERLQEERKAKKLIQSRKFQQFNVISISEKKIFRGGYMTPKKTDGSLTKASSRKPINPNQINNDKCGNNSFLNNIKRAQSRVDYNPILQADTTKRNEKSTEINKNSYLYYMPRRNKYQHQSQKIKGLNLNPVIKNAKQSLQLKDTDIFEDQQIPSNRYNENDNQIQQTYVLDHNGDNASQNELLNFIQGYEQQQDEYLNKFAQSNNKQSHLAKRRRLITYN